MGQEEHLWMTASAKGVSAAHRDRTITEVPKPWGGNPDLSKAWSLCPCPRHNMHGLLGRGLSPPCQEGGRRTAATPSPHPGPVTHIDPHVDVALTQIVQDAGLIQESHISHVASLVEFGMVRLLDIIFLHDEHLGVKTQHMHQDIVLSHHHGGIGQSTTHSLALCKKLDQWVQLLVQPCPIELGWGGTSTAL